MPFTRDLYRAQVGQDRRFISFLCYTDSHYVQKANEPIEQGERCAYKGILLMQYSCHKTGRIKFSSHREMRMGAANWCPSFWAKKYKTLVSGRQKVIILTSYTLEEIFKPPYSHYMDPVSYDFINYFGKMPLLVALLRHLFATGGDGQTCYTWFRWLLSNQCCQGTRKMKT